MKTHFKAFSISYQSAPVHIREQVALDETGCKNLLQKLRDVAGIYEALVLSTCNRTEVYYMANSDVSETILKLILLEKNISTGTKDFPYQAILDQKEASLHLFEVAMGLKSQVIGDLQISNQVKKAYQWAADMDMAAPFLHRLMHTIFFTNKRVSQETAFRDGAASVSYATAELVNELTANHNSPRILVIGTGEIGADTVKNLRTFGLENVVISNRTAAKATELALSCGYDTLPFEQVWEGIAAADVVISAVPIADFICKEQVERVEILSFKCFIDLCVPRSIEAGVQDVTGVLLYNIDHIQNRTAKTIEKRKQAIPQIEAIIAEEMQSFTTWTQEMVFSPTIQKLKTTLEQIRQEELARHLKQMDEKEAKRLDKITKGMMQKILKLPVLQLKAACKRGEAEQLADTLHDLFNLEDIEVKK